MTHYPLFKKKDWVFFINSGEESRDEPNEPHAHARRGKKEAYVFFDGCFVGERVVAKRGSARLHGNDRREIEDAFKGKNSQCRKKWNEQYPTRTVEIFQRRKRRKN